jgi:stage II sporulation protein D
VAGGLGVAIVLACVPAAHAASTFYLTGGGNGHGVGMSQYGAYGYALHGKDYKFILAHYYQGTKVRTTSPTQIVKVLLEDGGSAAFSGATKAGHKKLNPNLTYSVKSMSNGELALINPAGKRVGKFAPPLKVTGSGPLNLAGQGAYRGALVFQPDSGGGVMTINALGLDAYVRGVVASEMDASWPQQALRAQAVAARTYAITSDVDGSTYQLYPDTRSQEYGGYNAEAAASNEAVVATRGQIVTYNGAPAITYFFSSSGGYTEDVQNAFQGDPPEPWLIGVPDPYDSAGGDPYHYFVKQLTVGSAARTLSGLFRGALVGIRVKQQGVSHRIISASVVGTKGSSTISGSGIAQRFGLLSTLAQFTTINTYGGSTPVTKAILRAAGDNPDVPSIAAETAAGAVQFVRRLFVGPASIVYGTIFSGAKGAAIKVQQRRGKHWHAVRHVVTRAGGGYSAQVPGAGTYRIVVEGLDGPSVTVP